MLEQHELAYDGCKYKCYLKEVKGKKSSYFRVYCRNIDPKCKVAMHLPATVRREPVLPHYVPPPPIIKPAPVPAPRKAVPAPVLSTAADKLRTLADGMAKQIEAKIHSPISEQRVTARRAKIAQRLYEQGESLQQIQRTLYALADATDQGTLPPILNRVKTKTQIEKLHYLAKAEREWDRPIGLPKKPDLARYVEDFQERGPARYKDNLSEWEKEMHFFQSMGLTSDAQVKEAVKAIASLHLPIVTAEQQRQKSIKAMERDLVGRRIPGYFPTPTKIAERMVALADIQPGMEVLEPSAGKGNIADVIRELHPDAVISVIEWDKTLRDVLAAKGYNIVGLDFLEHNRLYDRIIMNPPFEKFQDIDHVTHAYSLLRPGGRLVSIMSESVFFREDKKAVDFRHWLAGVGGTDEKLPQGAFFSSERPTGVSARIVVIDKDSSLAGYFRRRYKRR